MAESCHKLNQWQLPLFLKCHLEKMKIKNNEKTNLFQALGKLFGHWAASLSISVEGLPATEWNKSSLNNYTIQMQQIKRHLIE